jgi:hypothetical protein
MTEIPETPEGLPHIFPTKDRMKHSHLVSYPLGAEVLSRTLDGVPQHGELKCSFYCGNTHQHLGKPVQLALSVGYSKRDRSFSDGPKSEERGVYAPVWHIIVYAVPKTIRHAVKTSLVTEGLPFIVRPWLIENAVLMGQSGSSAMNLSYDTVTDTLVKVEKLAILPERV